MSYARSPRPVCSTTNGTEAIGVLSDSVARVIGTQVLVLLPGIARPVRRRSGRACGLCHRLLPDLRTTDQQVQGLPLHDRLRQRPPALLGRVVLPDARRILGIRLGEPLDLLGPLLARHRDRLLLRQRAEEDLAPERALDTRTVMLLQLLVEVLGDLAMADLLVDHLLQHVAHEPGRQVERMPADPLVDRLGLEVAPGALGVLALEVPPHALAELAERFQPEH